MVGRPILQRSNNNWLLKGYNITTNNIRGFMLPTTVCKSLHERSEQLNGDLHTVSNLSQLHTRKLNTRSNNNNLDYPSHDSVRKVDKQICVTTETDEKVGLILLCLTQIVELIVVMKVP